MKITDFLLTFKLYVLRNNDDPQTKYYFSTIYLILLLVSVPFIISTKPAFAQCFFTQQRLGLLHRDWLTCCSAVIGGCWDACAVFLWQTESVAERFWKGASWKMWKWCWKRRDFPGSVMWSAEVRLIHSLVSRKWWSLEDVREGDQKRLGMTVFVKEALTSLVLCNKPPYSVGWKRSREDVAGLSAWTALSA